jgi:hypothetical protein
MSNFTLRYALDLCLVAQAASVMEAQRQQAYNDHRLGRSDVQDAVLQLGEIPCPDKSRQRVFFRRSESWLTSRFRWFPWQLVFAIRTMTVAYAEDSLRLCCGLAMFFWYAGTISLWCSNVRFSCVIYIWCQGRVVAGIFPISNVVHHGICPNLCLGRVERC